MIDQQVDLLFKTSYININVIFLDIDNIINNFYYLVYIRLFKNRDVNIVNHILCKCYATTIATRTVFDF